MDRPVFGYCEGVGRKCGSRPHQFWEEQPMDLDAVKNGVAVIVAGANASDKDSVDSAGNE